MTSDEPAGDLGRAGHLCYHVVHERLRDLHHVLVVGEGLIQFEHRELGIVGPIDALVAKDLPDLVHPLQAAHDKSLQVQLVGYTQVEFRVQRPVVGLEGVRRGASVDRLQHRRLHVQKAEIVEEPPDFLHDARAGDEQFAYIGVHGEIGVPLPIAALHVGEPAVHDRFSGFVRLFLAEGERPHGFRQQLNLLGAQSDLVRPRSEDLAFHTDPVPEVEDLHQLVAVFPQDVPAEVDLDSAAQVLDVDERRLAVCA